jgi:hypothetical protein
MTQVLLDPADSASISVNTVFGVISGDVSSATIPLRGGQQTAQQATFSGRIIWGQANSISITQDIHIYPNPMTQAEKEFLEQKEAFLNIPPLLLEEYHGQHVVSHNGQILDHDPDILTLVDRFFATHGDMPVYITKIGPEEEQWIVTPFF